MTGPYQRLFLIVLLAILVVLPFIGSRYVVELAVQIMIFSLFALSLNVLVGHVGAVSFGHAAFFALGGYACAWLLTRAELPLVLSLFGAVAVTTLVAFLIGLFCVRLSELYFAMLTMAFSMLIWAVALKWTAVTGGGDGFVGVAVPEALGDPYRFFWFTLVVVAASVVALWTLSRSTMGRAFLAVRENAMRASYIGINVRKMRLAAFTIAGGFAALAGCLLALYVRGMFPESAFWPQSGQVLIMVLLGGTRFFVGPILGAATLYLMETTIHQYTEYWPIVMGTILILIVLAAPGGLIGLAQSLSTRRREGRT